MIAYEQLLSRDVGWALREGGMHFEKDSAVHKALRKITRRLEELGIPYAIVGGMAMFFHGYRRFTEDVDLLGTAGQTVWHAPEPVVAELATEWSGELLMTRSTLALGQSAVVAERTGILTVGG